MKYHDEKTAYIHIWEPEPVKFFQFWLLNIASLFFILIND